ncbi:hypothetical protein EV182_001641, partial [Spiromyces aspiralis]
MSRSNNLISDEDQLMQVLKSKRLSYEVFDGLRGIIIRSLSEVDFKAHDRMLLLAFSVETYKDLEARTTIAKAWPNMGASAKQEIFNALCGPTQEGATSEEGTPGPAGVREVTEATGSIAIGSGPQKPTVTSTRAKSV